MLFKKAEMPETARLALRRVHWMVREQANAVVTPQIGLFQLTRKSMLFKKAKMPGTARLALRRVH